MSGEVEVMVEDLVVRLPEVAAQKLCHGAPGYPPLM